MTNERYQEIQKKLFQEGIFVISNQGYSDLANMLLVIVEYSTLNPKKEITLYISTTFDVYYYSIMLYDVIKAIPNPVSCVVIGHLSAYTTLIAAGCEKGRRFALPHAILSISEPSGRLDAGTNVETDITINARNLEEQRKTYEELLAKETGQPVEKIHQLAQNGTSLRVAEAIELGIIDKVI